MLGLPAQGIRACILLSYSLFEFLEIGNSGMKFHEIPIPIPLPVVINNVAKCIYFLQIKWNANNMHHMHKQIKNSWVCL
jgi:hypothetical protein